MAGGEDGCVDSWNCGVEYLFRDVFGHYLIICWDGILDWTQGLGKTCWIKVVLEKEGREGHWGSQALPMTVE